MTRNEELSQMITETQTATSAQIATLAQRAGIVTYGRTVAQRRESLRRQLSSALAIRTVAGIA
jgi:hypothetical protein